MCTLGFPRVPNVRNDVDVPVVAVIDCHSLNHPESRRRDLRLSQRAISIWRLPITMTKLYSSNLSGFVHWICSLTAEGGWSTKNLDLARIDELHDLTHDFHNMFYHSKIRWSPMKERQHNFEKWKWDLYVSSSRCEACWQRGFCSFSNFDSHLNLIYSIRTTSLTASSATTSWSW